MHANGNAKMFYQQFDEPLPVTRSLQCLSGPAAISLRLRHWGLPPFALLGWAPALPSLCPLAGPAGLVLAGLAVTSPVLGSNPWTPPEGVTVFGVIKCEGSGMGLACFRPFKVRSHSADSLLAGGGGVPSCFCPKARWVPENVSNTTIASAGQRLFPMFTPTS